MNSSHFADSRATELRDKCSYCSDYVITYYISLTFIFYLSYISLKQTLSSISLLKTRVENHKEIHVENLIMEYKK